MIPLLCTVFVGIFAAFLPVSAYIPAEPTNDTNLAIQDGLNVTDQSRLFLQWYSAVG